MVLFCVSFMVPKVKVRKHPYLLLLLVNCEINVLGFSFHCLANEVDSGDRVVHLHMKASVFICSNVASL